jgi:hypothetical protein
LVVRNRNGINAQENYRQDNEKIYPHSISKI